MDHGVVGWTGMLGSSRARKATKLFTRFFSRACVLGKVGVMYPEKTVSSPSNPPNVATQQKEVQGSSVGI